MSFGVSTRGRGGGASPGGMGGSCAGRRDAPSVVPMTTGSALRRARRIDRLPLFRCPPACFHSRRPGAPPRPSRRPHPQSKMRRRLRPRPQPAKLSPQPHKPYSRLKPDVRARDTAPTGPPPRTEPVSRARTVATGRNRTTTTGRHYQQLHDVGTPAEPETHNRITDVAHQTEGNNTPGEKRNRRSAPTQRPQARAPGMACADMARTRSSADPRVGTWRHRSARLHLGCCGHGHSAAAAGSLGRAGLTRLLCIQADTNSFRIPRPVVGSRVHMGL
jgi:hypothetical protein